MKKFLFMCAMAVSGLTLSTASAQDDCCYYECDPCCYDNNFNGFYIGGNVGVFSHVARRNDLDGFLTDNSGWSTLDTNVAGGVQGGYDWRCGNRVLGVVADWSYAGTDKTIFDNPNVTDNDNRIRSEIQWYTTIRGRAGLAVCDSLVYVTLGAAVADFKTLWKDNDEEFKHNDTRWGWTGGVGSEFYLTRCLSVGAEVLFMHFSERTKSFIDSSSTRYSFGQNDSAWDGRILVNYRI